MAQLKSIAKGKTKGFTFRITEELADDIKSIKDKCKQHGIKINMTSALTAALEKELKDVQKHIQKECDSNWKIGQESIDFKD